MLQYTAGCAFGFAFSPHANTSYVLLMHGATIHLYRCGPISAAVAHAIRWNHFRQLNTYSHVSAGQATALRYYQIRGLIWQISF